MPNVRMLDSGTLSFTVESRLLRELGERLVKQPEVAFVELIKNAHDADATYCEVRPTDVSIVVTDDGVGMTLRQFEGGWMRIGTSSKEGQTETPRYGRVVTGEKGIGRFAVRFLGTRLELRSVADDPSRGMRTVLTATFDWPSFDKTVDLGKVKVPYELTEASGDEPGTTLTISRLRPPARSVDLRAVRTASIGIVSPYRSLLKTPSTTDRRKPKNDPGFSLRIVSPHISDEDTDVADAVLGAAVLRATVDVRGNRLSLRIARRGKAKPQVEITETFPNSVGGLYADIRFFPQRKGTFAGLPVKGTVARAWIKKNAGVAVFDRLFRVLPYGTEGDDWLELAADSARNVREPRSGLARKHFPMDEPTKSSTQLNYMLRLPNSHQLVGIVQVQGRRSKDEADGVGLIPAADRQGFVDNETWNQLWEAVRGAIEAIAFIDRELQQEEEDREQREAVRSLRAETRAAIREIERNPNIRADDRRRIVKQLTNVQTLSEQQEERAKDVEAKLEVMSLLGVVAGFMTHEFGEALFHLDEAKKTLARAAKKDESLRAAADVLTTHIDVLTEYVRYSRAFVQGAKSQPTEPYPVRPRIQQMVRVFGDYAQQRSVAISVDVERELLAPLVPVSLYGGVCLNLYTNALKAVMARAGKHDRRVAFRAWNEGDWHHLEVLDTGVGIPTSLRDRVFDTLFTTTDTNRDPLGSGLGLGLTLVKRAVESYGGRVEVRDAPAGFSTCVAVRIPLSGD